jgi:hypothetical protein
MAPRFAEASPRACFVCEAALHQPRPSSASWLVFSHLSAFMNAWPCTRSSSGRRGPSASHSTHRSGEQRKPPKRLRSRWIELARSRSLRGLTQHRVPQYPRPRRGVRDRPAAFLRRGARDGAHPSKNASPTAARAVSGALGEAAPVEPPPGARRSFARSDPTPRDRASPGARR